MLCVNNGQQIESIGARFMAMALHSLIKCVETILTIITLFKCVIIDMCKAKRLELMRCTI